MRLLASARPKVRTASDTSEIPGIGSHSDQTAPLGIVRNSEKKRTISRATEGRGTMPFPSSPCISRCKRFRSPASQRARVPIL
jgi:hypothetical protein